MRRTLRRLSWIVPAVLFLAAAAFIAWGAIIPAPLPEALAAMEPGGGVSIQVTNWLVFSPAGSTPTTGLVFYPGGRVDPRAYAPAARALAAAGYRVVIVPMPLNLAVLNSGAAAEVMAAYPEVRHWAIGGHSLGGAMAAQYACDHPGQVEGLVLWAAYPGGSCNLSGSGLKVASISGSRDGLATPAKIAGSRPLLPAGTTWVEIAGGNHAQFGWYGEQSGDQPAAITRQEQQDQVVAATRALLQALSEKQ